MDFSKIGTAMPENVEEIAELFKIITDDMVRRGIHQWNYTYPLYAHVMTDVSKQSTFIIIENNWIVATITLDTVQDAQYKKIHWHNRAQKVLVIHRLGVHPEYQGKGYGKLLCLFAEKIASENKINTIRLDAYSLNLVSNQLYISLGYRRAEGNCYFHNNEIPFFCYEKRITLPFIHII